MHHTLQSETELRSYWFMQIERNTSCWGKSQVMALKQILNFEKVFCSWERMDNLAWKGAVHLMKEAEL